MSKVDVLEVLRYNANLSTKKWGPDNQDSATLSAVVELIEAVSPFAVLADQLDATEDTEAAEDEEWAKFRMVVKDYRHLRAALSRVRGAE